MEVAVTTLISCSSAAQGLTSEFDEMDKFVTKWNIFFSIEKFPEIHTEIYERRLWKAPL